MADIMLGQLLHRPTIDPISGDSPLPVQLSGSRAEGIARRFTGAYRIFRQGTLAANTTETVVDVQGLRSADVEYLEFATNVDNKVQIGIAPYKENGTRDNALGSLESTGRLDLPIYPSTVRTHKSAFWTLDIDAAGTYKMILRRQVPFGAGFRVTVVNADAATAYYAGVSGLYNVTGE